MKLRLKETDKAISELNNLFHEHGLKYRYENEL